MALTYEDQQYLIGKNLIKADWMFSNVFGNDLKDFLTGFCGFDVVLGDVPEGLLKNNLVNLNFMSADAASDPYAILATIISQFYVNDTVSVAGINSDQNHSLKYRRMVDNSRYVAINNDAVFVQYDKVLRMVAPLTAGGYIECLCFNPVTQDIYIGGSFTEVKGVACSNIARISSTDWSDPNVAVSINDLYGGFDDIVHDIAIIDYNLYAVGNFNNNGANPISKVARLDGGGWVSIAVSTLNNNVRCIRNDEANGNTIYIGLDNDVESGPVIMVLDGDWSPLQFPEINSDPNGYLVGGMVTDIAFNGLPGSNSRMVIVGGNFNFNTPTYNADKMVIVQTLSCSVVGNEHQFIFTTDTPAPATLNMVGYLTSDNSGRLLVIGNFKNATINGKQVVNCAGCVVIDNVFNNTIANDVMRPFTALGDNINWADINTVSGNNNVLMCGGATIKGTDIVDVKSHNNNNILETLTSKYLPSVFSMDITSDSFPDFTTAKSCIEYEENYNFTKVAGIYSMAPPP